MALVTTIGGSTANSYVSISDAVSIFGGWLNTSAWDAADATSREKALRQAATRLQRETWVGSRVTATQALAWPRTGAAKPDSQASFVASGLIGVGWSAWFDSDEIPDDVKTAQCLLALNYLNGYGQSNGQAVESFTADGVSVKFGTARPETILPEDVARLIAPLLQGNRLERA